MLTELSPFGPFRLWDRIEYDWILEHEVVSMLLSAIARPWRWRPLRRCLCVPLATGATPLSPSPTAGAMASHRRCSVVSWSQCDVNSFLSQKKRGQREVKVNMSQMFAVAVSRMFSNTSFCQPRGYGTEWLGGTLAYCQCESDIDGIAMHSIAVCWEEQWHDSMRAMPITQTIFILSWRYRTAKHLKHCVFAFQSWELDFRDLLAKGAARQELQGRHVLRVDKGNIL